jgi:pyridoxal phosphate enzyme (YggS family)
MIRKETYVQIKEEAQVAGAQLVVVSKTKPKEAIEAYYESGQRVFGENRVQELVDKQAVLPKDIEWHLIGHLQTNKVKYIASFVSMIHAVDSLRLLQEIDKRASQHERTIPCLLQFHIAEEESKYGLNLEEAQKILDDSSFETLQNIKIAGVMGMATFTDDKTQVRAEFKRLNSIFEALKQDYFATEAIFKEISMGMSGDYQIALEEGSTMIRVGSKLFQ